MSITILTPSKRKSNVKIIIENYLRQDFKMKELIVLLNYENPDLSLWKKITDEYDDISVHSLGSMPTLGKCLNFGVSKAKYNLIAKFDDDDYYGPNYLKNLYDSLIISNSDIVGKTSYYIYFNSKKLIGLKPSNNENKFCKRVAGSTFLFKKDIFQSIEFRDISLGEDRDFCTDALSHGFKIFSSDKNDYIYIRNSMSNHTWKIYDEFLLKRCINIKQINSLEEFIKHQC